MPFTNPILGGAGTLIREAIQSPDYVAGVSGWSINRDGSAEFSDVILRGSFATGPDGVNAYLTIDDGSDRTTIDFWNAAGTNHGYINSPQAAGVPQIGANSGLYTTAGTPARTRLYLQATGASQLAQVRDSDQTPLGAELYLDGTTAGHLRYNQLGGVRTGGRVAVASADAVLEYETAGTGDHGLRAASDGVHSYGTYLSDIGWSFSPGAGWSTVEFRMDRWGPFVAVHLTASRTGANIVGTGAVGPFTVGTITSAGNLPTSETATLIGGTAGDGYGGLNSSGDIIMRTMNGTVATGTNVRCDFTYFKS